MCSQPVVSLTTTGSELFWGMAEVHGKGGTGQEEGQIRGGTSGGGGNTKSYSWYWAVQPDSEVHKSAPAK